METEQLRAAVADATGRQQGTSIVTRLPGGAGNRIYWRIAEPEPGGRSHVVMELPPDPKKSEEVSKHVDTELPFLNVHRYLEKLGVRVPRIFADRHSDGGWLVIEDLGDRTLEAALQGGDREAIYSRAIAALARLRARAEKAPDPSCLAFTRAFDFDLYQWEFEHFVEYGLLALGRKPSEAELATLRRHFEQVSRKLSELPRGFTHRDYQSRNIMVLDGGEQVVIDFQDALQGPRVYDLVALLRDSYVELPRDFVERMLARYAEQLSAELGAPVDRDGLVADFDLLTVQRKLKDSGRFVFIDRVKKNSSFLVHIPASLRYVRDALARRPELAEVRGILSKYMPELA
jgi:N-acetylmuramate 1-kinase